MQQDPADLAQKAKGSLLAVLPLGATEYHGPHLPPETDTIIAQNICTRLASSLGDQSRVTILPAEPLGYSPEHLDHPATRSLDYREAIGRWISIGAALGDHGIKKFLLMNAHGGNSPLMTVVATELRVRHSMLCVATSWTRFDPPQGLLSADELSFGIHGGAAETSVMLALAPDLVDMSKAENFTSFQERLARDYRFLRAYGKHAFGWKMSDLNPIGAVGNASRASAEIGEALIVNAVNGLTRLVKEIDRFDMSRFARENSIEK